MPTPAQLQGPGRDSVSPGVGTKRAIEGGEASGSEDGEENLEAKRRRVLEETMDIDADSEGGGESDSSDEESDDDEEDETAELLRELEKIKKERAEAREREVCTILIQLLRTST